MKDLHYKIENAKKLLLKKDELKDKTCTFTFLKNDFDLSKNDLMPLVADNLIKLNNFAIHQGYIANYNKKRKEFETIEQRIAVASLSGGNPYDAKNTDGWKHNLTDQYCGLGMPIFSKLLKKSKADINFSDYEKIIRQPDAEQFIDFNIEFLPQKIEKFLNEKIELFITDELDLSYTNTQRFLSYVTQKEQFSIAINNLLNRGYPDNVLKVKCTEIWDENTIPQTNFLETALCMEKEGLIAVKDIFSSRPVLSPNHPLDLKYPNTIQIKILPDFNKYYEGVYKKYNPAQAIQENPTPNTDKKPTANDLKVEISSGKLGAYNDGTIRYSGSIIQMRNQINELCWYFMEHPNRLVTFDDIKENVIRADKRLGMPNSTIAKYISELRKLLKIHFKKDVIPSQNDEGWYFKP